MTFDPKNPDPLAMFEHHVRGVLAGVNNQRLMEFMENVLIRGGTGTVEILNTGTKVELRSDGRGLTLTCHTCRGSEFGTVDDKIMRIVPFIREHTHPQ